MDNPFGLFILFLMLLAIAQVSDEISKQTEVMNQINITLKDMK
jgi:hypothetical protein